MHILFVHQNFPAQFGQIASYLAQRQRFRCTFVSQQPPGTGGGIERIHREPRHVVVASGDAATLQRGDAMRQR